MPCPFLFYQLEKLLAGLSACLLARVERFFETAYKALVVELSTGPVVLSMC